MIPPPPHRCPVEGLGWNSYSRSVNNGVEEDFCIFLQPEFVYLLQGVDGVVSPVPHHHHVGLHFLYLDNIGGEVRDSHRRPDLCDLDVRELGAEDLVSPFCRTTAISIIREEEDDILWFIGSAYVIGAHSPYPIHSTQRGDVEGGLRVFLET